MTKKTASPVVISGADFKLFYEDQEVWAKDVWHEDETVLIDGIEVGPDSWSADVSVLSDTAVLTVSGGAIYRDSDELDSFEGALRKWLRARETVRLVVELPRDQLESVKRLLGSLAIKVVS
jgi:hypothetical protein